MLALVNQTMQLVAAKNSFQEKKRQLSHPEPHFLFSTIWCLLDARFRYLLTWMHYPNGHFYFLPGLSWTMSSLNRMTVVSQWRFHLVQCLLGFKHCQLLTTWTMSKEFASKRKPSDSSFLLWLLTTCLLHSHHFCCFFLQDLGCFTFFSLLSGFFELRLQV